MAPEIQDPRMTTIHPRIRYNTIGGVNGPLVILENVNCHGEYSIKRPLKPTSGIIGQIPPI